MCQNKLKFYKRPICKQIVFNKAKERIILDLTFLPFDLIKNTNYKYLLNWVDHFSKYVVSYLINKKTGVIIRDKLKSYFNKFGYPLQIGTDNGSEFNNKKVKKLLDTNNILHIKSKPYNPHSQGIVERVHRNILKIEKNLIYVMN